MRYAHVVDVRRGREKRRRYVCQLVLGRRAGIHKQSSQHACR